MAQEEPSTVVSFFHDVARRSHMWNNPFSDGTAPAQIFSSIAKHLRGYKNLNADVVTKPSCNFQLQNLW